jgi:hypothetical protein
MATTRRIFILVFGTGAALAGLAGAIVGPALVTQLAMAPIRRSAQSDLRRVQLNVAAAGGDHSGWVGGRGVASSPTGNQLDDGSRTERT